MHAILSYSKMGMADCGQEDPETLKDYFHKIQSAGNRLMSLINNLLDIAKMESGKMTLNKILYDFSATIEEAHTEATPILENKSLKVAMEISAKDTRILFDKTPHDSGAGRPHVQCGEVFFPRRYDSYPAYGRFLPRGGEALCVPSPIMAPVSLIANWRRCSANSFRAARPKPVQAAQDWD